ncbi:MAG: hypothetical protein JXB32_23500 [Deltaproteobacteria bacterium]|nr:hypothetical protein [Deltaproteobacteria bacterium]
MRCLTHVLTTILLAGGCLLSPQPDPPGANVVASAAADYDEVAVVGGAGAVPPGAPVDVARADDGDASEGFAGASGSFVVVVTARPGDVLLVRYREWTDGGWVTSAPRRVIVDVYDPVPPPMTYEDTRTSPYVPGDADLAGAGFLCGVYVDPPVAGLARVWALEGCVQPDVRVIAANTDTGNVVEALHAGGPFELSIPASIGDVLYLFAVRNAAPDQSSGVVRVVVPAP